MRLFPGFAPPLVPPPSPRAGRRAFWEDRYPGSFEQRARTACRRNGWGETVEPYWDRAARGKDDPQVVMRATCLAADLAEAAPFGVHPRVQGELLGLLIGHRSPSLISGISLLNAFEEQELVKGDNLPRAARLLLPLSEGARRTAILRAHRAQGPLMLRLRRAAETFRPCPRDSFEVQDPSSSRGARQP